MTEVVLDPGPLPVGPYDKKGAVWWGVLSLVAAEGALFAYLLFSYYYFDVQLPHSWRPDKPPDVSLALPDTFVLLASSVSAWWAERSLKQERTGRAMLGLAATLVLGAVFVGVQLIEWKGKTFTPQSGPYGSLYFTITGFHMAHVVVGVIALLMVLLWTALGYFNSRRNAAFSNAAIYWHFVDAVWLTVFFTFYVSPRLW